MIGIDSHTPSSEAFKTPSAFVLTNSSIRSSVYSLPMFSPEPVFAQLSDSALATQAPILTLPDVSPNFDVHAIS